MASCLRALAVNSLILVASATLANCSGDSEPIGPPAGVVASVTVSPRESAIAVGTTGQLIAQAVTDDGSVVVGSRFTWSTSDAALATVSDSGLVTGRAPGSAVITATADGKSGTATVTISPQSVAVASMSITPPNPSITEGSTLLLTAVLKDAAGNTLGGRPVAWEVENSSVAAIDLDGTVRGIASGITVVTAISEGLRAATGLRVTFPASAYQPRDLGTLGGANSAAAAINVHGVIVGSSTAANGRTHAFRWQTGSMIDLGVLSAGPTELSRAVAINSRGQIAGHSSVPAPANSNITQGHAFVWENGVMRDISRPPACTLFYVGTPDAMNEDGLIVGTSIFPCTIDATAAYWQGDEERFISEAHMLSSMAVDVNDAGQIVGRYWQGGFVWQSGVFTRLDTDDAVANNASGQVIGRKGSHAILWASGTMIDLGTLGGTTSSATDINAAGNVVGFSTTSSGETHAFLWKNGTMIDLGTLGGTTSRAAAINDAGQIVGSSTTAEGTTHAFLWQHGLMTDLGVLAGMEASIAFGINPGGAVIGNSTQGDVSRAVVWER